MFNFGLFATHIPYVIFMLAYVLYFGASILNHPEEISCQEDGLLDTQVSYLTKTSDHNYGAATFYSSEWEDISTKPHPEPPLFEQVLLSQKAYFRDKLRDSQLSSYHFSRPPPHFKLA